MKKTVTLVAAVAMMLGLFAGAAMATDHGPPPSHGHMLLLHVQEDGTPPYGISYGKCVDIAGGKHVARHHDTLHTGQAGEALLRAGHEVVPTAPLTPWANCAELAEDLPHLQRGTPGRGAGRGR